MMPNPDVGKLRALARDTLVEYDRLGVMGHPLAVNLANGLLSALDALEAANKELRKAHDTNAVIAAQRDVKWSERDNFRAERDQAIKERDGLAEAAREVERLFHLRDEEYTEEEGGTAFAALRAALAGVPGGSPEEPEHLRDDAPYRVCDTCGRKSWALADRCGMSQPDGSRCPGVFRWPEEHPEEHNPGGTAVAVPGSESKDLRVSCECGKTGHHDHSGTRLCLGRPNRNLSVV